MLLTAVERAHAAMTPGVSVPKPGREHTGRFARLPGRLGASGRPKTMGQLDVRLAARTAAMLHLGGGILLCVAALVDDHAMRPAVLGLAVGALVMGSGLATLERRDAAPPTLVYAAELAALGLVAGLIAASGGAQSAYPAFYLLPVAHAAVFQPRGRLLVACAAAVALLFAPLAYAQVGGHFVVLAALTLLPAAAAALVIHGAAEVLREERSQAARREAEALRIADSDPLTGAGNYRLFRRALEAEAARSRRHDQPFSLIVLDVDGFKAINDEVGHQAGDEALRRVAGALQAALRAEDVLCRQGGDEFAILAVQAARPEAGALARRLRAAVDGVRVPGLGRPLSVSVGWATFAPPVRSADALLARADRELRAAKRGSAAGRLGTGSTADRPERVDLRLATLSDCARSLALAQTEAEVAQIAIAQVIEAIHAAVAELWRPHPASGQPMLAARGRRGAMSEPAAPGRAVDLTLLVAAMRTNRLLVAVRPVDAGGDEASASPELVVPITHAGQVLGALRLRLDRPGSGTPGERRLALAIAAQVGIALDTVAGRRSLAGGEPLAVERCATTLGWADAAQRAAQLASAVATRLGMPADDVEQLRLAALLHRLGMVGVPAGLALRPFHLSEPEREVLQQHPLIAEELLTPIPSLRAVGSLLRHACERHDGRGYPDGLAGEEIPMASRALHAAVAYVAMTSERPYRRALSGPQARDELGWAAESGQLDPVVVDAMLDVLEAGEREPARP